MGVDYYNCDHCDSIFADCVDYYTFDIKGFDCYRCCEDCMISVRNMLIPTKLPRYHWLVKANSGRFVFSSVQAFEKWCEEQKEISEGSDTKFGVWKSSYFSSEEQEIWIKDRETLGVLCVDDLKVETQLQIVEVPERWTSYANHWEYKLIPAHQKWFANISWKNFHIKSGANFKKIFEFTEDSLENLKATIRRFISDNKLENRPMYAQSKDRNDSGIAKFFAFPEKDYHMPKHWYSCNKTLIESWKSGKLVNWSSVDRWRPKRQFVEEKLSDVQKEISCLEHKKRKLEKALATCDDVNNDDSDDSSDSEEDSDVENDTESEDNKIDEEQKEDQREENNDVKIDDESQDNKIDDEQKEKQQEEDNVNQMTKCAKLEQF